MSNQKEVVIIGAGVIGCSIAYHLAKRGVPAQLIERDSIASRASGKSWAIMAYPSITLSLFEDSPPGVPPLMPKGTVRPFLDLFANTYHRLPNIALEIEEHGWADIGLCEFPWIWGALSESEEKLLKDILSRQRTEGFHEISWIDAGDIKDIFPDISPQARGGLCIPCFEFEPYRYVLGLFQEAERLGANCRQGEAVGFRHHGSKITSVTLATGTEVEADVVVLAMGPWSGQGTSWLGKEMPMNIHRDQCVRVELPGGFPPYALQIGLTNVIPQANGQLILGYGGQPEVLQSLDVSILTDDIKHSIISDAVNLLPKLEEAKIAEHRGDLTCWAPPPRVVQPLLGRLAEWDNAYIATWMGLVGQAMSLGVGEYMADLIIAEGRIPYRIKNMMELLSPTGL